MNLVIVDFDGTLCNSEEKPAGYRGDWWGSLESLNNTPEINAKLLHAIEQQKAVPMTKIFVVTGRTDNFQDRIVEILDSHNFRKSYDYDELITQPRRTFVSTEAFKKETLKALLRQFPETKRVIAYDDKDVFHKPYLEVCRPKGIELSYIHEPKAFDNEFRRFVFSKHEKSVHRYFDFLKGLDIVKEEIGDSVKEIHFSEIELIPENCVISATDSTGFYRIDLFVEQLIDDENTFSFYLKNENQLIAYCGF